MVSIKFYISGNEFSSPWVTNWTGTLLSMRGLPSNEFKFNYKFISEKDKFLENNFIISQDIDELKTVDWAIFISSEIMWQYNVLLKLIHNNSYDVITGWHINENGSTDIIEKLNATELVRNNTINFMTPDSIVNKPLPFKIEYANMNFMAVKGSIFSELSTPVFRQFILEETTAISNNSVVFPWYYSFCHKLNAAGKEIFLDPTIKVSKISKSLL
jgi:hypothetical protein